MTLCILCNHRTTYQFICTEYFTTTRMLSTLTDVKYIYDTILTCDEYLKIIPLLYRQNWNDVATKVGSRNKHDINR